MLGNINPKKALHVCRAFFLYLTQNVMNDLSPIIRAGHAFQDADPAKLVSMVEKFKTDKQNFSVVYSTTVIAISMNNQQGLGIYTSALLMWDCTQAEFNSFRKRLELNLGKHVQ